MGTWGSNSYSKVLLRCPDQAPRMSEEREGRTMEE
jgi:hypothetical protein